MILPESFMLRLTGLFSGGAKNLNFFTHREFRIFHNLIADILPMICAFKKLNNFTVDTKP